MMRLLPLLVLAALLAGCGGSERTAETTAPVTTDERPATTVAPATTAVEPATRSLRAYRVHDGKVRAERIDVLETEGVARAALVAIGYEPSALTVQDEVARVVGLSGLERERRAEVVFTLTQFPTVRAVELSDGELLTRADFEDLSPQILVEAPLPDDEASSPLRITGTANTFEATFMVRLLDDSGKQLVEQFVTATSGSGTRGTFDVSVPYEGRAAKLVVFEESAKDGSEIHKVTIPLG
jgi:hypothetical protein